MSIFVVCFVFFPFSVVSTSVHYLKELITSSYEAALCQQMDDTVQHYNKVSLLCSRVLPRREVIKPAEGFIISARDADQFLPDVGAVLGPYN